MRSAISTTPTALDVTQRIDAACARLAARLRAVDLKACGLSEYNQRYLGDKIRTVDRALRLSADLLLLCLHDSSKPIEQLTLVDYGGGSGMIAFLAKESGFGAVIYNDIYDVCCTDTAALSKAIGLSLDGIVQGDIDDLLAFLGDFPRPVDAIVSSEVIEHVYDVPRHFSRLASLATHPFRIVHATSANAQNPFVARPIIASQKAVEQTSRDKVWGHKERDTLQSYFECRRDIVARYASELRPDQVNYLAHATRGLIRAEIEARVDEYKSRGFISYWPDHPTNTCDPNTGNWCEHLMDFGWLREVIEGAGFRLRIIPGLHPVSGSFPLRQVKLSLNRVISILGPRGIAVAPYYIVYATTPR